jgi:hypothetical protein
MSKDTKAAREEGLFPAIARHILMFQKGDDRLSHCVADGGH